MQYPEEFKQKVLSVYGGKDIEKMLETGDEFLGRYLDDASEVSISAKEIVKAFESGNLQSIYQKAKRQAALEELYGEWYDLRHSQRQNQGRHR